jgi:hypothetical protein
LRGVAAPDSAPPWGSRRSVCRTARPTSCWPSDDR